MSNEYKDWIYDTEYEEVYNFVNEIHKNQLRKDGKTPYVTHLVSVSNIVSDWMTNFEWYNLFDRNEIHLLKIVALLHDSVEDTETTLYDIESKFGKNVKEGVYWLTDISKKEDGNRKTRKQIDLEHNLSAPINFLIVKIADVYHNCSDIIDNDRGFAPIFLNEKKRFINGVKNLIETKYVENNKWNNLLQYCYDKCNKMLEAQIKRLY